LKVVTESGWFAARPSGTEDIYKIYAESFRGEPHLRRILEEAQAIVSATLAGAVTAPADAKVSPPPNRETEAIASGGTKTIPIEPVSRRNSET
jgi:hypothetical protein